MSPTEVKKIIRPPTVQVTSVGDMELRVVGLRMPLIEGKTDLAKLIVERAQDALGGLRDGDVVVVTSKVLLKSLGLMVNVKDVKPSPRARLISRLTGKDPIETELVLRHSRRILFIAETGKLKEHADKLGKDPESARKAAELVKAIMFVETSQGFIASDAGLDYSNLPEGKAIVCDYDFDSMARKLRQRIKEICGADVAVVVADTEFSLSNGKFGSTDVAVGSAGISPIDREFGSEDLYGRPKFGGLDIIVDELCSTAALLMKQSGTGIPVVIVRGLNYEKSDIGTKEILITRRRGLKLWRAFLKNLIVLSIARLLPGPPRPSPID